MSVRLTALFTAPPDGRQRLREVLEADARETRNDDGNERFELFVSVDDDRRLALVRELRDSEASSYTERDTPMFTCRRIATAQELVAHIGLRPAGEPASKMPAGEPASEIDAGQPA